MFKTIAYGENVEPSKDLIVEASFETIVKAIKKVLGDYNQSEEDSGREVVFTGLRETCPPVIKVRRIDGGKYVIISTSKCSVRDCSYWERCLKLDAERLEVMRRELLGLTSREGDRKTALRWFSGVERVDEKVIEKAYEKVRG